MNRRFVLIFDRTGSMADPVRFNDPSSGSRMAEAKESATAVVNKLMEYNPEGVDFYLFNTSFTKHRNTTPSTVAELFKKTDPYGGTDFTPVLKDAIEDHFAQSAKPTTIVVVTDGEPSGNGRRTLAELIVGTTKRMESDGDLGITFFQIGDNKEATTFLKTLDDDLVRLGAKFDIVDTKTCDEIAAIGLTEALLAAVND